jgi:hypothetical protein
MVVEVDPVGKGCPAVAAGAEQGGREGCGEDGGPEGA